MPRKAKTASSAMPPALRKPIAVHASRKPTVLETGSAIAHAQSFKANAHIPAEWLEKMLLLLDYYRIAREDPERWFALAFSLALDHVEGMKIAPNQKIPGAPKEWDGFKLARLYFEIGEIRQELGLSVAESCAAILADHNRWKHYPKCTGSTLARRYYEAQRDPLVNMLDRVAESKGDAGRQMVMRILNEELSTPASHTG